MAHVQVSYPIPRGLLRKYRGGLSHASEHRCIALTTQLHVLTTSSTDNKNFTTPTAEICPNCCRHDRHPGEGLACPQKHPEINSHSCKTASLTEDAIRVRHLHRQSVMKKTKNPRGAPLASTKMLKSVCTSGVVRAARQKDWHFHEVRGYCRQQVQCSHASGQRR